MRGESIERELQELERAMVALRVEYEKFLVGDAKLAPVQNRRKVETWVRRLNNQEIDRTAERFRFQSIQSRFNAMAAVWDKREQAREEGRLTLGGPPRVRPPGGPAAPPSSEPGADPARAEAGSPNGAATGSVEAKRRVDFSPLFDRYCTARQALGEDISRLRYERFEELVKKQAEEIRRRTGARRLVFEVQTVEGKVRLVGRPAPTKGQE